MCVTSCPFHWLNVLISLDLYLLSNIWDNVSTGGGETLIPRDETRDWVHEKQDKIFYNYFGCNNHLNWSVNGIYKDVHYTVQKSNIFLLHVKPHFYFDRLP